MKSVRVVPACLLILCFQVIASEVFTPANAQQVSPAIPDNVRKEIGELKATNGERAANAAINLGQMGERAAPAIPALIELLNNDGNMVGISTERAKLLRWDGYVLATGDKIYLPGLISICAAEALASIGKPALQPLLLVLKDKNPATISGAAYALALMKDPKGVTALLAALQDENPTIRSGVAQWLYLTKDPLAIDASLAALNDTSSEVRISVVYSLGKSKDSRFIEPLIAALADKDSKVQESAGRSLERITGQKFGNAAAKWREWLAREKNK